MAPLTWIGWFLLGGAVGSLWEQRRCQRFCGEAVQYAAVCVAKGGRYSEILKACIFDDGKLP